MASYTQRQYLKYTPAQLFDLVADVEKYSEFLPWIMTTRVRRRTDKTIWTDLTVGFGFLQKTFATVVALDRPHRISISSRDPMFTRFEQSWTFEPLDQGGTNIEYHAELECRSILLQTLIGIWFAKRAAAVVTAYIDRARRLYGAPP
jgi:coenzyme Q-binding protein COQ10